MQAGGAAVSANITAQAGMQDVAEVPVQIRDRGTGQYELRYTLVQVILQLEQDWCLGLTETPWKSLLSITRQFSHCALSDA